MARCEHCPVAAGLACRAEADPRYGFFCGQASRGLATELAAIRDLSGEPRPAPAAAPARVPLGRSLALRLLVRECPEAGPTRCGCDGLRSCRRLGRDVAYRECLACVQAREEEPCPTPSPA